VNDKKVEHIIGMNSRQYGAADAADMEDGGIAGFTLIIHNCLHSRQYLIEAGM
jgi:hypothetical protein